MGEEAGMPAQRAEARQPGEPVSIPLVTNSIMGSVCDESTTHGEGSRMRALISYIGSDGSMGSANSHGLRWERTLPA